MAENIKIELNRTYPNGVWEILRGQQPERRSPSLDGDRPRDLHRAHPRLRHGQSRTHRHVARELHHLFQRRQRYAHVAQPNGGETWVVGTGHNIRWSSSSFSEYVKIQINRNFPAGYWTTLISSTANDGVYSWIVTPTASTHARIRISGAVSTAVGDTADADFNIALAQQMAGPGHISFADLDTPLPTEAGLRQNYPNPFNPSTTFEFGVPEAMGVTLKVYDILGRDVATLLAGDVSAGWHRLTWNCAECPAGLYFVVLQGPDFHLVRKATFLK